jgi:hypothetical protein
MNTFTFFRKYDSTTKWRTRRGELINVGDLHMDHLVNIMNCLTGCGNTAIPNPYCDKTNEEWITIMRSEYNRRLYDME